MITTLHSLHSIKIRHQHGVVLVVSLLILLVMTLIGVVAMNTTTLQERMAGNTRLRELAFQDAEAALRDGEMDLESNSPTGFDSSCTSGLCLPSTTGTPVWDSIDWNSSIPRTYGTYTGAAALPNSVTPPKYIIEKLPAAVFKGNRVSTGSGYNNPGQTVQIYRITARATAENGDVVVELQSTYRP